MELKKSQVKFRKEDHTYWLDGKQLQGITALIRRQVFPDKYASVPANVLDARAAFGSKFHANMELYIVSGIEPDTELFKVFKEHYGHIKFIESEYIVSDNENYASPIDAIDENGYLYDFKTSSAKDVEYWRWQLSVYKYLFELQNGFSPAGLRVLWINKDMRHELIDIEPIDEELVKKLLSCEITGEVFEFQKEEKKDVSDIVPKEKLDALASFEEEIVRRESELKALKQNEDALRSLILQAFLDNGIKSFETDRISISVKSAYTRSTVDSKSLKDKYPVVYDNVIKQTKVNPSLTIKIKRV